ncbi:MAG: nucleotide exchange factor GrpE [Bacteroidetes bacterium]|nr:nucleotide exchange factor GrpE [Bacteroidota bacterium]
MKEKDVKFSDESENSKNRNGHDPIVDINTDENMAGTMHLNDAIEEEDKIEELQAEIQLQKDKYLRLIAEFDNFRKRKDREREELIQTAGKEVIVSLLEVLDDCDRAEKQIQQSKDVSEIKKGVQLVFNKLRSVLQSRGLRAMESINTEFDVDKHESITEIPAPSSELKGKVVDEVTKGYYLNDKIIRFAKVIVGK